MIDGNQLREEFGRYLAEHKETRWGMDAALMHVCKIAYDAGKADGPGEHRNGAAATLDGLLTDRMKRSVKVEQVLQDVADEKRPVLTPDECRALSLSLGTPEGAFSYTKAVLDTLYSQEFEIEVPAPAEVPMPEPDGFKVTTPDGLTYFRSVPATLPHHTVDPLISITQALSYGDAREAAGYARVLKWAVSRWKSEVENRPLENKNRRPLDDVWRQVVRFAGGDPDALLGPSHDAALRREEK